jgi:hypothetical protein
MLKKLLNYLKGIMADGQGNPSSKRAVTLLASLLMTVGFIANLFWDYTVDQFIFESVMYVVIAGLGITGAEKFAPKTQSQDELA